MFATPLMEKFVFSIDLQEKTCFLIRKVGFCDRMFRKNNFSNWKTNFFAISIQEKPTFLIRKPTFSQFVMDLVLLCLRNWLWRALGSDGQICIWRAMTDRFVMDLVLICLRNWLWRALGSDGQICNGFGTDLLKELTLERPGLCHTQV